MALSIIVGKTHAGNFKVLAGPGDPVTVNTAFKQGTQDSKTGMIFSEIQLWTSHSGLQKRKKFNPPTDQPTNTTEPRRADSSQADESLSPAEDQDALPEEQPSGSAQPGEDDDGPVIKPPKKGAPKN